VNIPRSATIDIIENNFFIVSDILFIITQY